MSAIFFGRFISVFSSPSNAYPTFFYLRPMKQMHIPKAVLIPPNTSLPLYSPRNCFWDLKTNFKSPIERTSCLAINLSVCLHAIVFWKQNRCLTFSNCRFFWAQEKSLWLRRKHNTFAYDQVQYQSKNILFSLMLHAWFCVEVFFWREKL